MIALLAKRAVLGACLACVLAVSSPLHASIFSVTAAGQDPNQLFGGNNTLGTGFLVGNSDIEIDALGVWVDSNGLQESHQVGLWNSGGSLVADVTVAMGTAASADGFAYVSLGSNFTLLANTQYTIGAFFGTVGNDEYGTPGTFVGVGVTPNSDVLNLGGGFAFPNGTFGDGGGRIIANARAVTTAIPSPSALPLTIVGMMALFGKRRRGSVV